MLFQTLGIVLITLILMELILASFYQFHTLSENVPQIRDISREYYQKRSRDIIQYQPSCAQYDPALTYKLKPGTCTISYKEFTVKYDVNKFGLRDDDSSLVRPDVIVLGDSFAMGWGVDQDKIFSSLLENNTKFKVLNAGMSSYGTARESILLNQLDTSNLKYLVVQYCSNDIRENKRFTDNNFKLDISSEEKYDKRVLKHVTRRRYKLFDFTARLLRSISRGIRGKGPRIPIVNAEQEYLNYLNILDDIAKKLDSNVKIVTFEMNSYNRNDSVLDLKIKEMLKTEQFAHLKDRVITFDASKLLDDSNYFILDDHINESGHSKIADEITKLIQSNEK